MGDERFGAVGKRIKEARSTAGFSQDHLAKILGIDRSAVSLIEAGKREINSLELLQISSALGHPMEFFFPSGEGEFEKIASVLQSAFRADGLEDKDLETLAWAREVFLEFASLELLLKEVSQ